MAAPSRRVLCEDAVPWLDAQGTLPGTSVVTSLPDVSELSPLTLETWRVWFVETARKVLRLPPPEGLSLFFQTDVKRDGAWVDKGYLVMKAAEAEGVPLLWHKIICRAPPGLTTFGRPAYAHLLCFSRGQKADPARSTPDVVPQAGAMTWARAMPLEACILACRSILEQTPTRCVVDPFCGVGTALAVANALGLDALGVEKSRKRAERAERLRITSSPEWRVVPDRGEALGEGQEH